MSQYYSSPLGANGVVQRFSLWLHFLVASYAWGAETATATARTTIIGDFVYPNVTLRKLTFGSCHNRKYAILDEASNTTIWTQIQQQEGQLWLWTGDAVYPPLRQIAPVSLLEAEYGWLKYDHTPYAKFAASTLIHGIYDDHDYGGNDMGKRMPDKIQRRDALFNFLGYNDHNYPTENLQRSIIRTTQQSPNREGVYHSVTLGQAPEQVKIILLDTRTFRDDHCLPSVATAFPLGSGVACLMRWISAGLLTPTWLCGGGREATVLGKHQWTWLQEELANSQAAVHVIVSSIQVLTTNAVMEGWGHFPAERERLLQLVNQAPGAILLSGDVHYAEILDSAAPMPDRNQGLVEVTSSGLTHTCADAIYGALCEPLVKGFHAHRVHDKERYYIGRNFGSLTMDWKAGTVQATIHNALTGVALLRTNSMPIIGVQPSLSDDELRRIPGVMDGHLIPWTFTILGGFAIFYVGWLLLL